MKWIKRIIYVGLLWAICSYWLNYMHAKWADAATHPCDFTCNVLLTPHMAGQTQWVLVPGSNGHARHARIGAPVLFRTRSDKFSNEDFSDGWSTETVKYYCQSGPQQITGYLCRKHPGYMVQEMEWRPYGYETGLCIGPLTTQPGERARLIPCGKSTRTLWVQRPVNKAVPLINGASRHRDPLVLSVDSAGFEVLQPKNTVTDVFDFVGPCEDVAPLPAWCPTP